jgi:hypothetical protein
MLQVTLEACNGSILQIANGTVNRDIQILKQLAKANISKCINETLPLEYQKCMIGLGAILVKTWDISNSKDSSERDKLQALSTGMESYRMKLDLLSNTSVVERAVSFVDRHQRMISQNNQVKGNGLIS